MITIPGKILCQYALVKLPSDMKLAKLLTSISQGIDTMSPVQIGSKPHLKKKKGLTSKKIADVGRLNNLMRI